jgi:hypothetical protein
VAALALAADTYPAPGAEAVVRTVLAAEVRFWDTALDQS